MENSKSWFSIAVPTGWTDILVRAIKVAVVAFVVLQAKEWFDAGRFDTPGTAADAAMIAGGTILLNAILRLAR
jgi:hypothetical protein